MALPSFEVREGDRSDVDACLRVLAALPEYFTDQARQDFARAAQSDPLWVGVLAGIVVGFVAVERRYRQAAEITFAAVGPDHRSHGLGKMLVRECFNWLRNEEVRFVEVKTLDASAGYEPYVATRAFWESCGFVQIDCIDPLPGWSPGNPSAIYVAAIE